MSGPESSWWRPRGSAPPPRRLGGKRALNKALDDESEDELEVTRQNLNDKIAALNAAIDNFSDQAESGVEKNVKKLNEELNGLAETGAGSKPKTSEA